MKIQCPIKRRLGQPDAVDHITETILVNGKLSSTQLAKKLCDEFGFRDANGKRRVSTCLSVLQSMENDGLIALPPSRSESRRVRTNRRLWRKVSEPQGVPERVDQITNLELVLVENEEQMKVWNELIAREHPLGLGWTAGRRVRYLVGSEHGWLGAAGFGTSA